MHTHRTKMYVEGNYLIKWILFSVIYSVVSCQKHRFLRQPFNTTVRVGGTALLRCAIDNIQTDVQWTVDDFALGMRFMDPRLSYYGSESRGEYNLRIENVKISDDAIYRCQANADYEKGIPPLRSRGAHLKVIVPPKTVVIQPSDSGAISVKYPNSVTITCTVPDTKPAAVINWKIDGKTFNGEIKKRTDAKQGSKLVTTSSSITLQPNKLQNSSSVECIVTHEGLDTPITKTSSLNVLYPPNLPRISGFMDHPVRSGEELVLECVVSGGNPLAKITWFIDDELIYGTNEATSEGSLSLLRHELRSHDDRKQLTCKAESPALDAPLEDHVVLQVYYPPEDIIIDRYPENGARENGVITFDCHYAKSNPRASLAWYINGEKLPLHWMGDSKFIPYVIQSQTEKSSVSETGISLKLTSVRRQDAALKVTCRATIPKINYVGEATVYPKVNYPARKVDVTVFSLNSPITVATSEHNAHKAGDVVLMRCEVKGGNPAPKPTWYLNNKRIEMNENTAISLPEVKVYTGDAVDDAVPGEFITTTTLELTLEPMHNNATITCVADHEAYPATVSGSKVLQVAFPPASVTINQFPSSLVSGRLVNLTCISSSSNPAAKITWHKNDVEIPEHFSTSLLATDKGSTRGYVTRSSLQIIPKVEDDGSVITCKAEVEVLKESVTQYHNLRIEYPPRFFPINGNRSSFNATEGDKYVEIEAIAHSNPPEIKFAIYRIRTSTNSRGFMTYVKEPLTIDRRFVWSENSGHLRINNLRQDDDGLYMVEATNSRGTTSMNITLNVFYPPKIIDIIKPTQTIIEGDSIQLRCNLASHPLSSVKISWLKNVPGAGRDIYNVTNFRTHSILQLENITAEDRGEYQCIVDNGVGEAASAQTTIPIEYSPVFDDASPNKVAVNSIGKDGSLNPAAVIPCIFHANPAATVSWKLENKTIAPGQQNAYSITQKQDGELTKSSLSVGKVNKHSKNPQPDILAVYVCITRNSRGESNKNVQIVLQGAPDVPSDLSVFNISDSQIWITWKAGFDGGDRQEFLVQFKHFKKNSEMGVYQGNIAKQNHAAITDLKPNTEYLIRVLARNQYGTSEPSKYIRIRTAVSSNFENSTFSRSKAYIIVLSIISFVVLTFVIVIIVLTIRRCKITKHTYKPKSIETDSESLTRAKSSLSSYGNEENPRHDEQKGEETCMLTDDIEVVVDEKLDRDIMPFEREQTRYFDCSMSHCSSRHSAEQLQEDGCVSETTCSFPTFRDDIIAMPATQPRLSRSAFSSQSARFPRSMGEEYPIYRNCTEPRFRQDVPPSDECLLDDDSKYYERPLDLPLPPTLPLYKHRTYAENPRVGSISDIISNNRQGNYQGNYRKCNTLGPTRFSFEPKCKDYCTPLLESSTSFLHNDDHSQVQLNKSNATCLYNVVSRPEDGYGYTSSLISIPGNISEKYNVGINERLQDTGRVRNSHSSSSTCNSGLYVKSLDSAVNEPKKRASIVNDDGTINTYGLDYPTSFSTSNVLGAINETVHSSASNISPTRQLCDAVPALSFDTKGRKPSVRFCTKPDVNDVNSDNDTDSGCGGSSDVAMRSPTSPEQYSAFSTFSSQSNELVLRL